jgi:hypothetical protein
MFALKVLAALFIAWVAVLIACVLIIGTGWLLAVFSIAYSDWRRCRSYGNRRPFYRFLKDAIDG